MCRSLVTFLKKFNKFLNFFFHKKGEKYSGKPTYFILSESKLETVADAMRLNCTQEQPVQSNDAQEQDPLMSAAHEKAEEERTDKDDHRSLILRVKNDQFFQPDLNLFTMWFKRRDEVKYQEYLLGMNQSLISGEPASVYSSLSAQQQHHHHRPNILISAQYSLIISALLSFLVNVCVSTAFLLTFFVSTMTELEFKNTVKYKVFFGIYLGLFVLFIVLQLGILLVFFFIYSNKPHSSPPANQQQHLPPGFASRRPNTTNIVVKYLIMHLLSSIMLILVPVYILAVGLPVMSDMTLNLHATSQPKIIKFFSVYFYFCYVISLIHFSSFVQLNSLFKSVIVFTLALVCGIISFVGVCVISNDYADHTVVPTTLFLYGFMKGKFLKAKIFRKK